MLSSPPRQNGGLPDDLPLAGLPATRERADAALNRARILASAQRLFAARGVEHVTMQDVAREASVGVGTLYRRFGDRAGLALALLEERETVFQDAILRGPPPLGPGATATERLRAFGTEYACFLDEHAELLVAAQGPAVPAGGPWTLYRTHVRYLLGEALVDIDVDYATETLLHSLTARLHLHLRRGRGWPLERIQEGWVAHVDAWLALGR